jgi:hypothetical protein
MENEPFSVVSAHDSTIGSLASILIEDSEWEPGQPGFASFIILESYENDTVAIRFRDGFEGKGRFVKQKSCG